MVCWGWLRDLVSIVGQLGVRMSSVVVMVVASHPGTRAVMALEWLHLPLPNKPGVPICQHNPLPPDMTNHDAVQQWLTEMGGAVGKSRWKSLVSLRPPSFSPSLVGFLLLALGSRLASCRGNGVKWQQRHTDWGSSGCFAFWTE